MYKIYNPDFCYIKLNYCYFFFYYFLPIKGKPLKQPYFCSKSCGDLLLLFNMFPFPVRIHSREHSLTQEKVVAIFSSIMQKSPQLCLCQNVRSVGSISHRNEIHHKTNCQYHHSDVYTLLNNCNCFAFMKLAPMVYMYRIFSQQI